MSLPSRFRVLTTILAVMAPLSAVAVTFLGIPSLNQISERVDLGAKSGTATVPIRRINASIPAIDRSQFMTGNDARREMRGAAPAEIETESKILGQGIETLRKLMTSAEFKERLVGCLDSPAASNCLPGLRGSVLA
jgi:hypothetical protein